MIQPTPALSYDELLRRAHALWMIIDNIDSADDSAKEDDAAFRRMVMRRVGERHKLFSCDDHDVLHPVFEAAVPQSPPPRPAFTPAWNQIKDIASANGLTAHIEVADTTELRVVLRRPDHYAVDRSAEAGSASPTVDRDLTSPLDRDKAEAGHPRLVDEMFVSRYGGYPISEVRSWPAERVQALASRLAGVLRQDVADTPVEKPEIQVPARPTLRDELQDALNRCSAENGSNTPDFILAEMLSAQLAAFNHAVQERAKWYGHMDEPGRPWTLVPDDELKALADVLLDISVRSHLPASEAALQPGETHIRQAVRLLRLAQERRAFKLFRPMPDVTGESTFHVRDIDPNAIVAAHNKETARRAAAPIREALAMTRRQSDPPGETTISFRDLAQRNAERVELQRIHDLVHERRLRLQVESDDHVSYVDVIRGLVEDALVPSIDSRDLAGARSRAETAEAMQDATQAQLVDERRTLTAELTATKLWANRWAALCRTLGLDPTLDPPTSIAGFVHGYDERIVADVRDRSAGLHLGRVLAEAVRVIEAEKKHGDASKAALAEVDKLLHASGWVAGDLRIGSLSRALGKAPTPQPSVRTHAEIVINQIGRKFSTDPGARNDGRPGKRVHLSNADNAGVRIWVWRLMAKPDGSMATIDNPTSSAPSFTPDVEGSYVIDLSVNGGIDPDAQHRTVFAVRAKPAA